MEITIVNEYYKPYITGGTELFLESLVGFLIKNGFRVKVICTWQEDLREYEKIDGVEVYRVKSSPIKLGYRYQIPGITFFWNHYNSKLRGEIKKIIKTSDILHINNSRHISLAPFQVGEELNTKILLDIHDYWPICFKKNLFRKGKICKGPSPSKCSECVLSEKHLTPSIPLLSPLIIIDYELRKRNLKFNQAICHSNWMSSILPFETKVIPYPIRDNIKKAKVKNLNYPINLVFFGRLQKEKGVHLLPRIANELCVNKTKFKINIVGAGTLEKWLKRHMKQFPAKFYGWVSDASIKRKIMSDSHLLLAPSIWPEPFGMVVTEAMSLGVPSITSNKGGLREIVEENNIGKAVDPTPNQISESIINLTEGEYKKFSENCIKNIKKYEKKRIMKKYIKLLDGL